MALTRNRWRSGSDTPNPIYPRPSARTTGNNAMIHHARHYATGKPIAVTVEAGCITAVADSDQNPRRWVAPAFFDPQINGCLGISFNSADLTPDGVRQVADVCRSHGIGAFCP